MSRVQPELVSHAEARDLLRRARAVPAPIDASGQQMYDLVSNLARALGEAIGEPQPAPSDLARSSAPDAAEEQPRAAAPASTAEETKSESAKPPERVSGWEQIRRTLDTTAAVKKLMREAKAARQRRRTVLPTKATRQFRSSTAECAAPEVIAVALLVFFFLFGLCYFTVHEGFTVIDALYFSMVVLTTVGYGDLGPTTPAGKIVTCFFVLYAMVMAAQALGILTAAAVAKAEKVAALAAVEHRNNARRERELQREGDAQQREHADSRAQLAVARRRARDAKRGRALASIALIVGVGTVYYACDPVEHKSWVDALYMCVITVTTVGFGDVAPSSARGRVVAFFYICAGTLIVGSALGTFVDTYLDSVQEAEQRRKLDKKLDTTDFLEADDDGTGMISEAEFVLYKLEVMEAVGKDTIQECVDEFREHDINRDGQLTRDELGMPT